VAGKGCTEQESLGNIIKIKKKAMRYEERREGRKRELMCSRHCKGRLWRRSYMWHMNMETWSCARLHFYLKCYWTRCLDCLRLHDLWDEELRKQFTDFDV
jgi:hypothetical protein